MSERVRESVCECVSERVCVRGRAYLRGRRSISGTAGGGL